MTINKREPDEDQPQVVELLPAKRTKRLEIPICSQYETSYMHRDIVTKVLVLEREFVVTISVDGHLKFWKIVGGLEFVKHYRAHLGLIVSCHYNKQKILTCGSDQYIKIFDILNFDMINMFKIDYLPYAVCLFNDELLGCSEKESGKINIYDSSNSYIFSIEMHKSPVHLLNFNEKYGIAVSADEQGNVEYWKPSQDNRDHQLSWRLKSETDLYEFRKNRLKPTCLVFSRDFEQMVTFSWKDRKYRIWNFKKAKITTTIDDSIEELEKEHGQLKLFDNMEFGRRLAIEKELEKSAIGETSNAVFDESGKYLIFPTVFGIKIVNIFTKETEGWAGQSETIRFLNISLYQGAPKKRAFITVEMAASENTVIKDSEETDPTIYASAYKQVRFYCLTQREPDTANLNARDIFNEKPTIEESEIAKSDHIQKLEKSCIIHTTFGDITIRLFPEFAPKAVENFLELSKRDYYNRTIFHRCIKGFMIQGGDPEGDGTGGKSIWGMPFEDEIHPSLRHDRPYTLSMANRGPKTNESQFFITTVPTPWLDGKHTIFGRCTGGQDVVHRIEHVECDKHDRPKEPVRVLSVEIR